MKKQVIKAKPKLCLCRNTNQISAQLTLKQQMNLSLPEHRAWPWRHLWNTTRRYKTTNTAHRTLPAMTLLTGRKPLMPGGRPSTYTEKLTGKICTRLAEGESLRSICNDATMPAMSTVMLWLQAHEKFSEQYARGTSKPHGMMIIVNVGAGF